MTVVVRGIIVMLGINSIVLSFFVFCGGICESRQICKG